MGHWVERSEPLATSTESLRTADGTFPSRVYTKTFLSKRPGWPLGLYLTDISADSPGATELTEHVADAHEQVETRRTISTSLSETF